MVKGRLPRESNPLQGQPRGYAPSFDTTGDEDYGRVSPENPWPSANYVQNDVGIWMPVSKDNPMPTQLTGSIVERFELEEEAGTIPAGTWKRVDGAGHGGSALGFTHSRNFKMYKKASLFFRRSEGELDNARIVFGGVNAVDTIPYVNFDFTENLPTRLNVTEKMDLLTNDFHVRIKAADDSDLVCRNLYLYLWRC